MSERDKHKTEVEVSEIGRKFIRGTHVAFSFHRHRFKGIVEKQLHNSAMIKFDDEFENTATAIDLKNKIIISYAKMKVID